MTPRVLSGVRKPRPAIHGKGSGLGWQFGILFGCLVAALILPTAVAAVDADEDEPAPVTLSGTNSVVVKILLPHTRYATRYYIIESGLKGPTVMIVGGVHGDEPAGALAAEVIRHWTIKSGRLVVIPAANIPALAADRRLTPELGEERNNLNRNFPLSAEADAAAARGDQAQAIWQVARASQPDWLVDLHEGVDFHRLNPGSTGGSIIASPLAPAPAVANELIATVNGMITHHELDFVHLSPPVDGSLARAAGEHLHIPSLIIETTRKDPLELRVRQQEVIVHGLLAHLGMVPVERNVTVTPGPLDLAPIITPPKLVAALYHGPGTGGNGPPNLLKRFNAGVETSLTEVSPQEIGAGVLTNFDAVIFAGGSGSRQAAALGAAGQAQVREFVAKGGGYIGICGGAYLALCGKEGRLRLINAIPLSSQWRRGRATLKWELTMAGTGVFGSVKAPGEVLYHNGPVVGPAKEASLTPYEPLAFFRTETAQNNTPAGIMVDSPAIFAAAFQKGRVVCISPNPEQTAGLENIVPEAVAWVTGHADRN